MPRPHESTHHLSDGAHSSAALLRQPHRDRWKHPCDMSQWSDSVGTSLVFKVFLTKTPSWGATEACSAKHAARRPPNFGAFRMGAFRTVGSPMSRVTTVFFPCQPQRSPKHVISCQPHPFGQRRSTAIIVAPAGSSAGAFQRLQCLVRSGLGIFRQQSVVLQAQSRENTKRHSGNSISAKVSLRVVFKERRSQRGSR